MVTVNPISYFASSISIVFHIPGVRTYTVSVARNTQEDLQAVKDVIAMYNQTDEDEDFMESMRDQIVSMIKNLD